MRGFATDALMLGAVTHVVIFHVRKLSSKTCHHDLQFSHIMRNSMSLEVCGGLQQMSL